MNIPSNIQAVLEDCPLCDGKFIPYNSSLTSEERGEAVELGFLPPAISRSDNQTEICSRCGTQQALDDFLTFTERLK